MLVGIIAAAGLRYSPYAFYYTDLLEEMKTDYEIIVPDRYEGVGEGSFSGRLHILPWKDKRGTLLNYILYARKVKKLAVKRYDFLIVLTTNMGVFCCPWLKKRYNKRYILDVRDYTHENIPAFFAMEKEAVRHSALNVVSSRKFQAFLPKGKYLCCHNITTPERSERSFQKAEGRLVIGYVGMVAYEEQCRRLMDLVDQDQRFEFHFYGMGPAEPALRVYAERLECSRIRFFGAYQAAEKDNLLQKVDVLFTVYGSEAINAKHLLANKLYDALYYRKPLLVSPGTFMEEMGGDLAFSVNLQDPDALNKIWDWYQDLDGERVDAFASRRYAALWKEHRDTGEEIKRVIKDALREEEG